MPKPDDSVALIVGDAEGIGLACAHALYAAGHRVAVTYPNTPPPERAPFLSVPCDVSSSGSVDAAFDLIEAEIGKVSVVVSNAGVTNDGLLMQMTDDDFMSVINTNLAGAFRVARRSARPMMKSRWGRIIFIGSSCGRTGHPGPTDYVAATAGLIGMTRSIAKEFAARNITVNMVSAGIIDTDAANHPRGDHAVNPNIPMRRHGTPEEVSATVTFLASEAAGYITGAVIPVDGGVSMSV